MSQKKLEKVVLAGNGRLAFGMGAGDTHLSEDETSSNLPYITIGFVQEPREIGEKVISGESEEMLTILFKNIESLEVMERMCSKVRKYLENKEKNLAD
jgi:hypothetical protein